MSGFLKMEYQVYFTIPASDKHFVIAQFTHEDYADSFLNIMRKKTPGHIQYWRERIKPEADK